MTNQVDVSALELGDRLLTVDGSVAEVLNPSQDGTWLNVRYVADSFAVSHGGEDLCSIEDIARVLGKNDCKEVAANAEGEALYCVLTHAHSGEHVWRNASCQHDEEDERRGLCEHDHERANR